MQPLLLQIRILKKRIHELEEEAKASDIIFDVMQARIERYEAALERILHLRDVRISRKIARNALEGE